MALYIKANRLVAEHIKVDKIRLKLSDGNFMLWQADISAFGRLFEINQICERIGAIALQPWEAKQEQDATVVRPLPVASDERFILHNEEVAEDQIDSTGQSDGSDAPEEESEVSDEQ